MRNVFASLICGLCLLAAPASAEPEQPPTPLDDTLRFMGLVMKNGSISVEEKQLIDQFRIADTPVSFEFDGVSETFLAPDPASREVLDFFYAPVNLNSLWLVDSDHMLLFVRVSRVNDVVRDRMTNFAASKFNEQVEQSSIDNGYRPIRDTLTDYYNQYRDFDLADRDMASRIGYDAMMMVDEYHNDQVPYFIYNWMMPGGYMGYTAP